MKNNTQLLNYLLVFSIIVAGISFLEDFRLSKKTFNDDLFKRVYSAKLLQSGINPYTVIYSEDKETVSYYGIADDHSIVTNATPSSLFLHILLMSKDYITQQKLWFYLQWAMLLLILLVLYKMEGLTTKSQIVFIYVLAFIAGSYFWRLHVERGQIYILHCLFIIISYYFIMQKSKNEFLSGLILGIAASFRLHTIFISIPFILFKSYRVVAGIIIGFVSSVCFIIYNYGLKIWTGYFDGINLYNNSFFNLIKDTKPIIKCIDNAFCTVPDGVSVLLPLLYSNSSIQHILKDKYNILVSPLMLILFLFITFIAYIFVIKRFKVQALNYSELFFTGSCFVLLSEYFTVICRYSYCNVIWILTFALAVFSYRSLTDLFYSKSIIILLLGIYFSLNPGIFPDAILLSDYLMLIYFITINILLFRKLNNATS